MLPPSEEPVARDWDCNNAVLGTAYTSGSVGRAWSPNAGLQRSILDRRRRRGLGSEEPGARMRDCNMWARPYASTIRTSEEPGARMRDCNRSILIDPSARTHVGRAWSPNA